MAAWGGAGVSAWGRGVALTPTANDADDVELNDENTCMICMAALESVRFIPCQHNVCDGCVGRFRAELIKKPDTKVMCPYCRGPVTGYEAIKDGEKMVGVLAEANRAAAMPSATPKGPGRPGVVGHGGVVQSLRPAAPGGAAAAVTAAHQQWVCPRCRISNGTDEVLCSQCELPSSQGHPVSLARLDPGKDLVTGARAGNLVKLCNEKFHPGINAVLASAGSPSLDGGGIAKPSRAGMLQAVRVQGHKKLVYLIKTISDAGRWPEVAFHNLGSYTMQDLLQVGAMQRAQLRLLQSEGVITQDTASRALGGKSDRNDLLGMMVAPLLSNVAEAMRHEKGFYVMMRIANAGGPHELSAVIRGVLPVLDQVLKDPRKGGWVVNKCVWRLSDMVKEGTSPSGPLTAGDRTMAVGVLADLGDAMEDRLKTYLQETHHHRLVFHIISAVFPIRSAGKMAHAIADMAPGLSKSPHGLIVLQRFFKVEVAEPSARPAFRDLLCQIADKLSDNFASITLTCSTPGKAEGSHAVQQLSTRLAEEGEEDWVGWISCELAVDAKLIEQSRNKGAWGAMIRAMSQPVLDPGIVQTHIDCVKSEVPHMLDARVWQQRSTIQESSPQHPLPQVQRCSIQPRVTTLERHIVPAAGHRAEDAGKAALDKAEGPSAAAHASSAPAASTPSAAATATSATSAFSLNQPVVSTAAAAAADAAISAAAQSQSGSELTTAAAAMAAAATTTAAGGAGTGAPVSPQMRRRKAAASATASPSKPQGAPPGFERRSNGAAAPAAKPGPTLTAAPPPGFGAPLRTPFSAHTAASSVGNGAFGGGGLGNGGFGSGAFGSDGFGSGAFASGALGSRDSSVLADPWQDSGAGVQPPPPAEVFDPMSIFFNQEQDDPWASTALSSRAAHPQFGQSVPASQPAPVIQPANAGQHTAQSVTLPPPVSRSAPVSQAASVSQMAVSQAPPVQPPLGDTRGTERAFLASGTAGSPIHVPAAMQLNPSAVSQSQISPFIQPLQPHDGNIRSSTPVNPVAAPAPVPMHHLPGGAGPSENGSGSIAGGRNTVPPTVAYSNQAGLQGPIGVQPVGSEQASADQMQMVHRLQGQPQLQGQPPPQHMGGQPLPPMHQPQQHAQLPHQPTHAGFQPPPFQLPPFLRPVQQHPRFSQLQQHPQSQPQQISQMQPSTQPQQQEQQQQQQKHVQSQKQQLQQQQFLPAGQQPQQTQPQPQPQLQEEQRAKQQQQQQAQAQAKQHQQQLQADQQVTGVAGQSDPAVAAEAARRAARQLLSCSAGGGSSGPRPYRPVYRPGGQQPNGPGALSAGRGLAPQRRGFGAITGFLSQQGPRPYQQPPPPRPGQPPGRQSPPPPQPQKPPPPMLQPAQPQQAQQQQPQQAQQQQQQKQRQSQIPPSPEAVAADREAFCTAAALSARFAASALTSVLPGAGAGAVAGTRSSPTTPVVPAPAAPSPSAPAMVGAMPPPPPPAPSSKPWDCPVCTYEHTGREADFLTCCMCGHEKP
eukprot:CAMPEP_0206137778 /NCGR_PEP_ID=MMETSP1473-20131121/2839_1 /ASSEMBLY_ACC=CAM_ASM_001109 /TAXON_ID=1461547 /ORGANISM="Stichococcus sp, Strain RCC1054" /LENGTH=1500 /DNA_ID=CAMNT_0053531011 /DNA_START=391 /DNA_END=4893 /DNA_ORIENTATION=+